MRKVLPTFGALALVAALFVGTTHHPAQHAGPVVKVAQVTVSPGDNPDVLLAAANVNEAVDAYLAEQDRLAVDAYLTALHDEAVRQAAARPAPRPTAAAPQGPREPTPTAPYADAAECTRAHEGWYTANTGNGYYGAYQFLISTWNNTVRAMGRDDLVGVLPSDASPADQDAAFWFLWSGGAGAGHWGGRCIEYA